MGDSTGETRAEHGDAPTVVEVRRRGTLLGVVGVAAAAVATAYLTRALATGATLDWVLTVVLAGLALLHLAGLLDARAPLVVADEQGLRLRRGRTWTACPWAEVSDVELVPAAGLREGRLTITSTDGGAHTVPLGLVNRTLPAGTAGELLAELAGPSSTAAGPEPVPGPGTSHHGLAHLRDPRPVLASGIAALADRLPSGRGAVRIPAVAARLRRHGPVVDGALAVDAEETVEVVLPEEAALRRHDDLAGLLPEPDRDADEDPRDDDLTEAILVPVADPVVGPDLVRARARLGLSIDELAARTRIRPRVIAGVEVDDFAACGGDFYARGHLRTLARVLGLEAAPLLAAYDEHYAAGPVVLGAAPAARLAELPERETAPPRERPRWSVLVAAVMAVVLAWSVARLALDAPRPDRVAGLGAGSGGVHGAGAAGAAVPVLLRAAGGGAHVVVRDGDGRIAFTGDLAFGESRSLEVIPPVRVDSSDGGVEVVVSGEDHGRLGDLGRTASGVFDGS